MPLTGKRNVKIDSKQPIHVVIMNEVEANNLEDYVEVVDSGMEACEEKEVHLQGVKRGSNATIPLPVIEVFDNPARNLYPGMLTKKKIKWSKDCPNEYIFDDEEKKVLQEINNGNPVDINMLGENEVAACGLSREMSRFALRRTLVRFSRQGHDSRACFRRRSIAPTFRSRKNITLLQEKISRLGGELTALNKLCQLQIKQIKAEKNYLKSTFEIVKEYLSVKLSKRDRASYKRKILGIRKSVSPTANVFKTMVDRQKIAEFKKRFSTPDSQDDYKDMNLDYDTTVYQVLYPYEPPKKKCQRCYAIARCIKAEYSSESESQDENVTRF